MSRVSTLILLGVLVFLSPFLGLPLSWLFWILPILGIAIVVAGLSLRQSRVRAEMRASATPASESEQLAS
jgi:TRAP-type C4-dicarboxylate transport system permease small subunit